MSLGPLPLVLALVLAGMAGAVVADLLRASRARHRRADALRGLSWHGRPYPHPRHSSARGARLWLRLRYGVRVRRSPVVGGHVITSRRRLSPRDSLEVRRLTALVLEADKRGNRGQEGGA